MHRFAPPSFSECAMSSIEAHPPEAHLRVEHIVWRRHASLRDASHSPMFHVAHRRSEAQDEWAAPSPEYLLWRTSGAERACPPSGKLVTPMRPRVGRGLRRTRAAPIHTTHREDAARHLAALLLAKLALRCAPPVHLDELGLPLALVGNGADGDELAPMEGLDLGCARSRVARRVSKLTRRSSCCLNWLTCSRCPWWRLRKPS